MGSRRAPPCTLLPDFVPEGDGANSGKGGPTESRLPAVVGDGAGRPGNSRGGCNAAPRQEAPQSTPGSPGRVAALRPRGADAVQSRATMMHRGAYDIADRNAPNIGSGERCVPGEARASLDPRKRSRDHAIGHGKSAADENDGNKQRIPKKKKDHAKANESDCEN